MRLPRVDEIIIGLQIIKEYDPDPIIAIDDGVIYAGVPSRMPYSACRDLERLNWRKDKEIDSWSKRV